MENYIIIYKSGHVQKIRAEDLEVVYSTLQGNTRITSLEWKEMRPMAMFFNLDAIESVWKS